MSFLAFVFGLNASHLGLRWGLVYYMVQERKLNWYVHITECSLSFIVLILEFERAIRVLFHCFDIGI